MDFLEYDSFYGVKINEISEGAQEVLPETTKRKFKQKFKKIFKKKSQKMVPFVNYEIEGKIIF